MDAPFTVAKRMFLVIQAIVANFGSMRGTGAAHRSLHCNMSLMPCWASLKLRKLLVEAIYPLLPMHLDGAHQVGPTWKFLAGSIAT